MSIPTDYPTAPVSSLFTAHSSQAEMHAFSSKERDVETGLSYFGSRYYSSDLSVWLSVDPMSDKYPSMSPYNYCANNPVRCVDPNGEDLVVANNEESHNDILSIVKECHRDRVSFGDDGKTTVNMDGLKAEDAGLSLLNDLCTSDKKFYYESADDAFYCDEYGDRKYNVIANKYFNGVLNASKYGEDSNGRHGELPMTEFDGQVVIATSGSFSLHGNDVRKNIVYHELLENYLRTDKKMDYCGGYGTGAHRTAARIENKYWGNFAGQCTYSPPMRPLSSKSKNTVLNYLNYGTYK